MTDTPIAILKQAADLGVKLSFIPPDTLDVNASRPWPKDFAGTLRANKSELIALLPFSTDVLKKLHEIKRTSNARITPHDGNRNLWVRQ